MAEVIRLRVDDASQVGSARRRGVQLATNLGWSQEDAGRVGLVLNELATNLVKHTTGEREVIIQATDEAGSPAIEILAIDRGPGSATASTWLRDGYTTSGTPGTGLGAVSRTADRMELQSTPGAGTAILSRILPRNGWRAPGGTVAPTDATDGTAGSAPGRPDGPDGGIGAVSIPIDGEEVNGDAWATRAVEHGRAVFVVDGLGHGPEAGRAASEAIELFRADDLSDLGRLMSRLDEGLRPTRGAAAAASLVDRASGTIRYAGVGNIAGTIVDGAASRSLVSHNGTLGRGPVRAREFSYALPAKGLLVMHSDGCRSHWRLSDYPGLTARHPSLIAGVLYRDHRRGGDDVTVVAARLP